MTESERRNFFFASLFPFFSSKKLRRHACDIKKSLRVNCVHYSWAHICEIKYLNIFCRCSTLSPAPKVLRLRRATCKWEFAFRYVWMEAKAARSFFPSPSSAISLGVIIKSHKSVMMAGMTFWCGAEFNRRIRSVQAGAEQEIENSPSTSHEYSKSLLARPFSSSLWIIGSDLYTFPHPPIPLRSFLSLQFSSKCKSGNYFNFLLM